MGKNKYGIIPIELGSFIITNDKIIKSLIPEKTKELLLELASKNDAANNSLTKLIFIHFNDQDEPLDIRTFATSYTTDEPNALCLSFSTYGIRYELFVAIQDELIMLNKNVLQ